MALAPQFESLENCTTFTNSQLKNINLARYLSGILCMVIATLIVFVLLFYKAYKSLLQRLFLYITAATAVEEIAFSLAVEHQFYYPSQKQMCVFYGFFLEWTVSITNYLILCKIFYLVYLLSAHCQGGALHGGRLLIQKRNYQWLFECACILFAICFPLTYLWIPFKHRTYTLAGGWCWIRTIDRNCKSVGLNDEIIFGYGVFEAVGVISTIFIALFAVVYCRLACIHEVVRHQHLITLRQTLFLLGFLVTSVAILSVGFAVRIYTGLVHVEEEYTLWILLAIAPPVYQIVYPIGFLVYLYTLKKFSEEAMQKAFSEWKRTCNFLTRCKCEVKHAEQVSSQSDESFVVPNEYSGNKQSECTPLLRASDFGCNSLS